MQTTQNRATQILKENIPHLLAIYAFGSRVQQTHHEQSDWDIAILVEGYCDPLKLWDWSDQLGEIFQVPVDLVDFRKSSTVLQYQILMTGERWWARDMQADLYECGVFSDKFSLDEKRANILHDISQSGAIYER